MGESCEQGRVKVIGEQPLRGHVDDRRGRPEARAMEQLRKNKAGMGLEGQVQRF